MSHDAIKLNVGYVRAEVIKMSPAWTLVSDCVGGQTTIKDKTTTYLPKPDPSNTDTANTDRYSAYLLRALFYNVTARTLRGLVGQVFSRDTNVKLPESLTPLMIDAEGDGVSLEQQSKRAVEHVLQFGRAGLLADFPTTEGGVSKQDLESGKVKPILKLYKPENIINWRTKLIGSELKFSLIVLQEYVDDSDDGFEITVVKQYRVLRLNEQHQYTVQIYKEEGKSGEQLIIPEITPKDGAGKPFDTIPFTFIGAENNDHIVDAAPMFDLAVINIAHYRNSADYEEATYVTGQPTPWISGLTEDWVTDVLKGEIQLGSRAFIPLPKDGEAGLLQVEANSMPFEAMGHKERQMVALGAKLVEQKQVQRTATEATQDEVTEISILSNAVKNVSTAYEKALGWAAMFVSGTDEEILFQLNSDFDLSRVTAQERIQLIQEWQSEAISFTEMRTSLKKAGVAYQEDDIMKDEVDNNPPITALMNEKELEEKTEITEPQVNV